MLSKPIEHSILIENLLSYDEIGRMFLISAVVMTGFVTVFYIGYRVFKPLYLDNKAYIKQLMESIEALNGKS